MNRNIMKHTASTVLAALALALLPASAKADDGRVVCTANVSGQVSFIGTNKKENYDVAIRLTGSQLRGLKVESISVPFKGTANNTTNATVWVSRKLALQNKKNVPDGPTAEATMDGTTLAGTFAEPFTIDSDTLYLGYSFSVSTLVADTKSPLAIAYDDGTCGMFVHTSRTYMNWNDRSSLWGCSAISAVLSGVADVAAAFDTPSTLFGQAGVATDAHLTLHNFGAGGVSSIDYTYTQGTQKGNGHLTLDTPIAAIYNASQEVTLPLDAVAEKGNYPLTITIDKVNGTEQTPTTVVSNILLYSRLPKHHSVMEEYTGTWCGWCPRGFVAMEVMHRLHPDDFIALSYHNADAMEVMTSKQYPSSVSGFPSACIDRTTGIIDPFNGKSSTGFGIEKVWKTCQQETAPADMETRAYYSDGNDTIVAKALIYFPVDRTDADRYQVEFVLVGDSLHGAGYDENGKETTWLQHNYLTAENSAEVMEYEEAAPFFKGNSVVDGLYYNDVVLATTRLTTGMAALPASVTESDAVEVSGMFEVDNINVDHNANLLRVVALLIDSSNGSIVNASNGHVYASATGISDVNTERRKTANCPEAIYDLQGRRVNAMGHGLHIVRLADGRTVKVAK